MQVCINSRVGVNSISELESQLNFYSNSRIGIRIEISETENCVGIENNLIGWELEMKTEIEMLHLLPHHLLLKQSFPKF